jgi:uroporphyrinogen-III synthase
MRTILAKEPDKRIVDIFQSNSNIEFTFLPIFRYQELYMQSKWLNNLKNGYFNWIIFTSFRSWQILMNQIASEKGYMPDQTKIAVFGPASVEQIKEFDGRIDFTVTANNAVEFGLKFINKLSPKQKIAYPANFAASTQLEKCLSINDIRVYRKNIYKPQSIIYSEKINEIMVDFNPDSMVFFSSKSVKTFMDNCSTDILNYIAGMQLFALGNPTSKALENYSEKRIINPKYPNIHTLSDLIYEASETEEKKNYVITKTE